MDSDEIKDLEYMERLEAEGRRVYDPITKHFDHGNKLPTDCSENKHVTLPKSVDNFTENSLEMIRERVTKLFREYRSKNCNDKGDQKSNLTPKEVRGLRKLRKRVKNKSIVVLKTDKSGKLTVMERDIYEKMGLENAKKDQKIS